MFFYKLSSLIFLMLSVICYSCDNPDISRVKRSKKNISGYTSNKKLNTYTGCVQSMEATFGDLKHPLGCLKHAIYKMKLYGDHRSKYPIHVTFYYQEFHTYLSFENILLPYDFCIKTDGELNHDCFRDLQIFDIELSQEDILKDYDSKELQLIQTRASALNQVAPGESSSSYSEGLQFKPDELQLIENALPGITQDIGPSVESPEIKSNAFETRQFIVLKNALYYHKFVGPNDFVPQDESKRYFHTENSYGDCYLKHIVDKITLTKRFPKNVFGPKTYCRALYPRQTRLGDVKIKD